MTDDHRQMTDDRTPKTEDQGKMTKDQRPKTNDRRAKTLVSQAIPPNLRGIPDPALALWPLSWRDLVATSLVNRTDILITSLLLKETCYQNVGSVDK